MVWMWGFIMSRSSIKLWFMRQGTGVPNVEYYNEYKSLFFTWQIDNEKRRNTGNNWFIWRVTFPWIGKLIKNETCEIYSNGRVMQSNEFRPYTLSIFNIQTMSCGNNGWCINLSPLHDYHFMIMILDCQLFNIDSHIF